MPSALPVDLRERVVTAIDAGASRREPARPFAVGRADARRSTLVRHRGAARIVPAQMRARLAGRGLRVGVSNLSRFFERHGITRQKTPATRASSIERCEGGSAGLFRGAARHRSGPT